MPRAVPSLQPEQMTKRYLGQRVSFYGVYGPTQPPVEVLRHGGRSLMLAAKTRRRTSAGQGDFEHTASLSSFDSSTFSRTL